MANFHIRLGQFCHEKGQRIDGSAMLLLKVAALYGNEDLSDVQIVVGHQEFDVHKLILCCSSDVFKIMLTNRSWPDCKRQRIVLKEEPECIAVFEDFLRYLYTGMIHLSHFNVLPILMLADKYNVCDLRELAIEYMCSHVVSMIPYNHAVSWYQYGVLCGHRRLTTVCKDFICMNFHKVTATEDFLLMEKDVLTDFIRLSDLVVPDEFTLYNGIARWLNYHHKKPNISPLDFRNLVLHVLSFVRFALIPPSNLQQLENDLLAATFKDFFTEKVHMAMQYHALTYEERRTLASVSGKCDIFRPRNYTNDMWGTLLSIDGFSNLPVHDVRPLFFSSPISGSDADENRSFEWNVDLFPKGVHFQKCIMIGLWRNLEVSGTVYNTVRFTLEAKTPGCRTVDVSVLVTGVQDNIEYVCKVIGRRCIFDQNTKIHNFDDIVPFDELNSPGSPYLSGPDGDSFKITIVIKPV